MSLRFSPSWIGSGEKKSCWKKDVIITRDGKLRLTAAWFHETIWYSMRPIAGGVERDEFLILTDEVLSQFREADIYFVGWSWDMFAESAYIFPMNWFFVIYVLRQEILWFSSEIKQKFRTEASLCGGWWMILLWFHYRELQIGLRVYTRVPRFIFCSNQCGNCLSQQMQ